MTHTQKFILNYDRKNMIKSILPVVFFFFIVLTIGLVSADKVVTTTTVGGLEINTWQPHTIQQNADYAFLWDVSQSGMLTKANLTNCTLFFNQNGVITTYFKQVGAITSDGNAWYILVKGGNFSEIGHYNFQIDCYLLSNTTISGNALSSFDVTIDGNSLEENNVDNRTKFSFLVFFFLLAGVLIVFGIIKGDSNMSMFGTFILFLLSLYTLINGFGIYDNTYTNMFSLILVGLSVYVAAKCMEDWLSNLNRL